MSDPRWVLCSKHRPSAAVQLVCAPSAGAGILTFRSWPGALPDAEIWCVHLPGRDGRREEPYCTSIAQLADDMLTALCQLRRRPIALFGHSMGALVAFELARRLESAGEQPLALIVAGRRAPSVAARLPPIARLPVDEFVQAVRQRYPSIPDAVLTDPELASLFIPTLRADLAIVEEYRHRKTVPLSCPVLAYAGRDDPHTRAEELDCWSEETLGPFGVRWFPGGHFFVESARDEVLAMVGRDLAGIFAPAER